MKYYGRTMAIPKDEESEMSKSSSSKSLLSTTASSINVHRLSKFLNQASSASKTAKSAEKEYQSLQRIVDSASTTEEEDGVVLVEEAVELVLIDPADQRDDENGDKDGDFEGPDLNCHDVTERDEAEGEEEKIQGEEEVNGHANIDADDVDDMTRNLSEIDSSGTSTTVEGQDEGMELSNNNSIVTPDHEPPSTLSPLPPPSKFLDLTLVKVSLKETSTTSWVVAGMAVLLMVPLQFLVGCFLVITALHDAMEHQLGHGQRLWTRQLYDKIQMYQQSIAEAESIDHVRRQHVCWWPSEAAEIESQLERARNLYHFFLEQEQAKQTVAVVEATRQLEHRIEQLQRELQDLEAHLADETEHHAQQLEEQQMESEEAHRLFQARLKKLQMQLEEKNQEMVAMKHQQQEEANDREEQEENRNESPLQIQLDDQRSSFESRLDTAESHGRALQALLLVQEWEQKHDREARQQHQQDLEQRILSQAIQCRKITRYLAELVQMVETPSGTSNVSYKIVREAGKFLKELQTKTQVELVPPTRVDTMTKSLPLESKPTVMVIKEQTQDEATETHEVPSPSSSISSISITPKETFESKVPVVVQNNNEIMAAPPTATISGSSLMDLSLLLTTSVDAVYFWTMPMVSSFLPSFLFNRGSGSGSSSGNM